MARNKDLPILERIKTIVPRIDDVAAALQVEHDTATRIRKLMLIVHAGIVELGEVVNQLTLESTDIANAQTDLARTQEINMKAVGGLANKNAGAQTVIQNLDVWLKIDPISIAHFLQIVELSQVTEAARHLDRDRVEALMNALVKARTYDRE